MFFLKNNFTHGRTCYCHEYIAHEKKPTLDLIYVIASDITQITVYDWNVVHCHKKIHNYRELLD